MASAVAVGCAVASAELARAAAAEPPGRQQMPVWSDGPHGAFAAGSAVAGAGYGALALDLGYGRPHWDWLGLQVSAFVSPWYAAFGGGLTASLVIATLSVSWRQTHSFDHGLVPAAATVSSAELTAPTDKLAYASIDGSLFGGIPLGRLLVLWELTWVRPLGQSADVVFYEELQRVAVARRGVWTSKLSPHVRLTDRNLYLGLLAEHLTLLGRPDSLVLRIGPSVYLELSSHWDAAAYATLPFHTPDELGAWDGFYGALGLRYRFALRRAAEASP